MRGKLSEVYTDCDKKTIDGMLLIIVWKAVSEMEKGGLNKYLDQLWQPHPMMISVRIFRKQFGRLAMRYWMT
ncbi:hypothetical protein CsSME_00054190 [Camellia sinensis var. sinensis]